MKQPKIKQSTAPAMAPRKAPVKALGAGKSAPAKPAPATVAPNAQYRRDAAGNY